LASEKLYTATISHIVCKKRRKVLLFNIIDSFGCPVRNHMWVYRTKQINKFMYKKVDTIKFCGSEYFYGRNKNKIGISSLKSIHVSKAYVYNEAI